MAYVYADLDALTVYQQKIVQTVTSLESQTHCKDELIESAKNTIREAISRAIEVEEDAYQKYIFANNRLNDAQLRANTYDSNSDVGSNPQYIPSQYYADASETMAAYRAAQEMRCRAEETLKNFEGFVRSYEEKQQDGISHFKKILTASGDFFDKYISKLVQAKLCTTENSTSNAHITPTAPAEQAKSLQDITLEVIEAGKHWSEHLTTDETIAISGYTGSDYSNINARLRGLSETFDPGNERKALLIHSALKDACIPYDCTVFRGASSAALGRFKNLPDKELIGKNIAERGFMSTSINKEDSFGGDIKLIINVPKGARGAYVGYISQLGHTESEVLFDLGQIMKITNVERDETGKRIIYLSLIFN